VSITRETDARDGGRREFFKAAVGLATAGLLVSGQPSSANETAATIDSRRKRIASNTYAVRHLFKRRVSPPRAGLSEARKSRIEQFERTTSELKAKYAEITMLDFPQFTKDTFPGVVKMDLWSSLFGDVDDPLQFTASAGRGRTRRGFDPSKPASKRYLDQLANKAITTGVHVKHISNNAPRNLSDTDEERRKEGVRVAKVWLDAAKQIGATSMRVNTGGPRIRPQAVIDGGYPRDLEVVQYLNFGIQSFKELAEYGEKVGVKVTIENHWGLAADPMNIRIIINEVNSRFCEASPDFCNWEHEFMLYHGLDVLIPLATSMCHAKRWTRYPNVDIARCVEVLNRNNYQGDIALEYESDGDPVQGSLKLMEDVVAALA
jgi:hypothetical protein